MFSKLLRTLSKSSIRLSANKTVAIKNIRSTAMVSNQQTSQNWQSLVVGLDTKQVDSYLKEKLIMVDENDRVIGSISKGEAHAIETVRNKVFHRALSVLVFDDQGRFLLTQRASSKITFPDYFTNACCSHPLSGTTELEDNGNAIGVKRAALRRLSYELGVPLGSIKLEEVKLVNRLAYRAESDGGHWGEAEIDYIFILRKNLELRPNSEEVKSFRFITKDEMHSLILRPQDHNIKVTPWIKLLAKDLLFSYWDNLDCLDSIAKPDSIIRYNGLFPA